MSEPAGTADPLAATGVAAGGDPASPAGLVRLDPSAVRLRRGLRGDLQLLTAEICHLRVRLSRPFPLSRPDAWVAVQGADGREIGLMPGLGGLDRDSRALAEEALRMRYFTPRVTAIVELRDESEGGRSGGVVWELQTDRGPATLHMPNTNDHLQPLGGGRILLTDRAGNRYEIPDVHALDAASRGRLARFIWL